MIGKAVLRDLSAHRGRVAMILAAVSLGVAFVVASVVVTESMATLASGDPPRDDVAVVVQAPGTPAGLTPADRDAALTPADVDRLAAAPGAATASGVVLGHAALIGRDGTLGPTPPRRAGTNFDTTQRFTLTAGRAPARRGEVAIGAAEADATGLGMGDTARVILADGRSDQARVVGLFAYRATGSEPAPAVAYDHDTALRLLGGRFDRVELTTRPGTDSATLADAVASGLGPGHPYRVVTGEQLAADERRAAEDRAATMRALLLVFAVVAVFVGMVVIANAFAMLAARRTHLFALLRVIGAGRAQVRRAMVAEAAVLGLAGAVLGVAAGVGVGLLAARLTQPSGQRVGFPVPVAGIIAGVAVGVVVTVIAGYGSARRAAAVAPLAALRSTETPPPRRTGMLRAALGLACAGAGVAAVAATAGTGLDDTERVIGMLGAVVAVLGLLLLAPPLVRAALGPAARLLGAGRPAVRLALRNAARDPRRTAATASALLIGVAVVGGVATLADTSAAMAKDAVGDLIPAATTLVRAAPGSALDPDVLATVRATPGVTAVLATPHGHEVELRRAETNLGRATIIPVDPAALAATLTPPITAGSADLRRGMLLPDSEANALRLRPGDTLTLAFDPDISREITVAGSYRAVPAQAAFYVDIAAVPAGFIRDTGTIYATGADPAALARTLANAFRDRPDVQVTGRDSLADEAAGEFEQILSATYALSGVALLIAVLGVINTLALAVLERTREIGVLRALGADRRNLQRTTFLESLTISALGGIPGMAVGVLLGAVMQHLVHDRELWRITVPYPVIAILLAGMLTVAVLAAAWPASRASATDILTAITTGRPNATAPAAK